MTNTCHSIQLVGEIAERSSRTARLTEVNTSDETLEERMITFETNCETNEYFHLFINTDMLVIAARTHVDYVECTSMVILQ